MNFVNFTRFLLLLQGNLVNAGASATARRNLRASKALRILNHLIPSLNNPAAPVLLGRLNRDHAGFGWAF